MPHTYKVLLSIPFFVVGFWMSWQALKYEGDYTFLAAIRFLSGVLITVPGLYLIDLYY